MEYGMTSCRHDCECRERLGCLAETLSDEDRLFKPWQIQAIEDVVFCMLSGIEHHCADPVMRMWARAQLTDPWWDYQKARDRME
jgi:hypothetical protein